MTGELHVLVVEPELLGDAARGGAYAALQLEARHAAAGAHRQPWVRADDGGTGGAHALMAMSTQRRTLDFDREFNELKEKLPLKA